MTNRYSYFLGALLACGVQVAYAEKADRSKEVEILFARTEGIASDNGEIIVSGDVVLTQGTLKITGERMHVKKDARDNVTVEIKGMPDKQVTFRAKRDNAADFMEGVAGRVEFDQRKGIVKLFERAVVKSGTMLMTAEFIAYNQETEQFEVDTPPRKTGDTPTARSRIVIPPPKPDPGEKK